MTGGTAKKGSVGREAWAQRRRLSVARCIATTDRGHRNGQVLGCMHSNSRHVASDISVSWLRCRDGGSVAGLKGGEDSKHGSDLGVEHLALCEDVWVCRTHAAAHSHGGVRSCAAVTRAFEDARA